MANPRKWRQLLELLSGLKIPAGAGVGKVLSSDASGNATWALPGEKSVAMAYRKAAFKIPNAEVVKVPVDTIVKDPGGNFNLTKGCYVVPSEGYYAVSGSVSLEQGTVFTFLEILTAIYVNGVILLRGNRFGSTTSTARAGSVATGIVFCKAGDEIELRTYQTDSAKTEERSLEVGTQDLNLLSVMRVGEGPEGAQGKEGPKGTLGAEEVTTEKIAKEAVIAAKIAANAVTEAAIKEEAVTNSKLRTEAVTAAKIKPEAITAGKLENNAVITEKIKALAVTEAKLACGAAPAYSGFVTTKTGEEIEPNASFRTFVSFTIETKKSELTVVEILVNKVFVGEDSAGAAITTNSLLSLSAVVPAGQKYEIKVVQGKVEKAWASVIAI